MFLSALSPRTNCGSNSFAKRDGKRRAFDEVGAMIEKETNDGGFPTAKHLDEKD
ncbi:MAG: hypothetical protein ACREA9_05095 [Pyrinomonadaceae bacterium]